MTLALFCRQPFTSSEVDHDFALEFAAAKDAGFTTALVDHDAIVRGDLTEALRRVPPHTGLAVYRGFMMRAVAYEGFYDALRARNITLVNDAVQYRLCHHLPESYPALEGDTPRTTWVPLEGELDLSRVFAALGSFGSGPVILKDYVKSQKHAWDEACFIPHADDHVAVESVVRRFLELTGDDLTGGLVFREYVPLEIVGRHPRSDIPLAAEVRTFWVDGACILSHPYWGDLARAPSRPPSAWMEGIADRVRSRFFSMDVALRTDGAWTVIEVGDGQVTGLPDLALREGFYARLHEGLA